MNGVALVAQAPDKLHVTLGLRWKNSYTEDFRAAGGNPFYAAQNKKWDYTSGGRKDPLTGEYSYFASVEGGEEHRGPSLLVAFLTAYLDKLGTVLGVANRLN